MVVNLNRLAILEGVSLNKVLSVLADRGYLLENVEFDGYDFNNPMIEERFVENIVFACETIPKEDKLKNKVIVDLFKERIEILKKKAKIEKEVYKAIAFVYKKFDVYIRVNRKEIFEMCEELYEECPEDLKVAIYRELSKSTGAPEIVDYYQSLFFENEEKKKIKAEIMLSFLEVKEEKSEVMEIDGVLVDIETGEVVGDGKEEDIIEYREMKKEDMKCWRSKK